MRIWVVLVLAALGVAVEPSIQSVDHVLLPTADAGRSVECLIFYPDGTEPTGMVVFSHDVGRSRGAYWYLGEAWAKAGLVVIFPTHARSDRTMIESVGISSVLEVVRTAARDPLVWHERASDIEAIATHPERVMERVPALQGRLGHEGVGVAGHAFGALSAGVAGGMRPLGQEVSTLTGVRGVVLLGPPGPCDVADQQSWSAFAVPTLIALGGIDPELRAVCGGTVGDADWWALTATGLATNSWVLSLPTARHFTFSNGGWGPAVDPDHVDAIADISAAFWRRELLGDTSAEPARGARGPGMHLGPIRKDAQVMRDLPREGGSL